ncbi:DUF4315 family protein [Adlercreutzia sp. ZJ473]|uniref:DUF4315 family protein n=1 Tax=Adlercreutzia sp. ZJ473 TaxID=2722822 RepID=UPI00155328E3|nr:DUF4315 family protein [Adlercreutzia sp. ZJ473]
MNKKIERLRSDIKRIQNEIAERKSLLKAKEDQLRLLEDEEIVKVFRSKASTTEELLSLLARLEKEGPEHVSLD